MGQSDALKGLFKEGGIFSEGILGGLVDDTPPTPTGGMPSPTSVNDAIITKQGDVIRTHEDDSLIATKNPIITENPNNEMMNSMMPSQMMPSQMMPLMPSQVMPSQMMPSQNEKVDLRQMKTEPSFNELQRVIVTNKIELNELTLAMIDKMLSESRMNSARIIKLLQQFQSSASK